MVAKNIWSNAWGRSREPPHSGSSIVSRLYTDTPAPLRSGQSTKLALAAITRSGIVGKQPSRVWLLRHHLCGHRMTDTLRVSEMRMSMTSPSRTLVPKAVHAAKHKARSRNWSPKSEFEALHSFCSIGAQHVARISLSVICMPLVPDMSRNVAIVSSTTSTNRDLGNPQRAAHVTAPRFTRHKVKRTTWTLAGQRACRS